MQVRIPTGFRQFLRQLPNGEESYWEEGRRQKSGKRFGSFGERESQDKGETEIIRILAFFCRKYISWVQIMPHGCFFEFCNFEIGFHYISTPSSIKMLF